MHREEEAEGGGGGEEEGEQICMRMIGTDECAMHPSEKKTNSRTE